MFDYINLPKDPARRATALKEIAAAFDNLLSYQQNVVADQTPEQTLLAFMQKHLNPSECSGFLGMVFNGDALPEEFANLNVMTIESVVTDTLQLTRRFDVNDLLSVENNNELSRLAALCHIPFDRKDRRAFLAHLFADLRNFYRVFPVCAGLNEFFTQRYAFDAAGESSNWISLRSRISPETIVDDNSEIGKDVFRHLCSVFPFEMVQRFAVIVGLETVTRIPTLTTNLALLGPQEILKRLRDKYFITAESFNRWVDFNDTDFEEFFDCFVAACISAHKGDPQEMIDINAINNSDQSVAFDEFATYAYLQIEGEEEDDEEEEEEDEDDDWEEESDDDSVEDDDSEDDDSEDDDSEDDDSEDDDSEDDDSEDDEQEEGKHPLFSLAEVEERILRRIKEEAGIDVFKQLEFQPTVVLGNAFYSLQKYDKGIVKIMSMDEIKKLRHYEILEKLFALTDIDFHDYVDPADTLRSKFMEWQSTNLHKGSAFRRSVLRTILGSLVSIDNLHTYAIGELLEEIECIVEDADEPYKFYEYADKINSAAEQYSLPLIDPDSAASKFVPESEPEKAAVVEGDEDDSDEVTISPEHASLIELVVSNKWISYSRAQTMSYSELAAIKRENESESESEPAPAAKGKVTKENFRDVIPTLNRQELIQELAARGYSDLSLKKLGAPRLAEMFMNAMERMASK